MKDWGMNCIKSAMSCGFNTTAWPFSAAATVVAVHAVRRNC